MNFGTVELSDDDLAFKQEVATFLAAEAETPDHVPLSTDHDLPSRGLHERLGDRGWLYPGLPRSEGGADLDALKQRILHDALLDSVGAAADTLVPPALVEHGSERLKAEILPLVRSGRIRLCLGYSEPDSGSDMAAARTRAVRDGDEWVINGSKMWTTFAHDADWVFLLARTDPDATKHHGLTMFLVPLAAPGVEIHPIWAMAGVRTNTTFYRDVRVPDWCRVGPVDEGWAVVSGPLAAEHSRHEVPSGLDPINGLMGHNFCNTLERLLAVAVEWAVRTGVDTDPVVRARLGQLLLDIEVGRNYGELAKAVTSELLQEHGDALVDLAAPETVPEFDWARGFAAGAQIYGGTTEIYRNNYARGVLKLPRSR